METLIIRISILTGLVMLLLTLAGCHGFITVYGRVFEWVDAPADSESFMYIKTLEDWRDSEIALGELMEHISENIKISPLYNTGIIISSEDLGADGSYYKATSNISGEFKLEQLANGGTYGIEIKASKSGYVDAIRKTVYDESNASTYAILAVLVKVTDKES